MDVKPIIQGMKDGNDGLIGIYDRKLKGRKSYICRLPRLLQAKHAYFDNPIEACLHYNITVREYFGDEAVLCDPLAVTRKFILNV